MHGLLNSIQKSLPHVSAQVQRGIQSQLLPDCERVAFQGNVRNSNLFVSRYYCYEDKICLLYHSALTVFDFYFVTQCS